MNPLKANLRIAVSPLLLGLVFFSASLTPSLIPRDWLIQGVLAGFATAIGYMVGRFLLTLWRAAELPTFSPKTRQLLQAATAIPVLFLLIYALSKGVDWQNSIRARVGMPEIEATETIKMMLVAVIVIALCFLLGMAVQALFDFIRKRLYRVMPRRTADISGLILAALIIFFVTRDGIVNFTIDGLDQSYAAAQNLFEFASEPPQEPWKAGSAASLGSHGSTWPKLCRIRAGC